MHASELLYGNTIAKKMESMSVFEDFNHANGRIVLQVDYIRRWSVSI